MENHKFITDSISGTKFPINGCIVSTKSSDLPKFGGLRTLSNHQLPPGVDLRNSMTPVEYQGNTNSCVGNALAGAYEFLIKKNSGKHVDVSRLFIYYNARCADGMNEFHMRDSGTSITSAIKGLTTYGCCKEQHYPFNQLYLNSKPPEKCYLEGKNHRVLSSMSISLDLNEMKACLAEGYPFAFGLRLFESFEDSIHNGGRVLMPSPSEIKPHEANWHALLAVGYDESGKYFIVRNSYGEQWGDKGYCYIPYEYMCNRDFCVDLHAIREIEGHQIRYDAEKQQQQQQPISPKSDNDSSKSPSHHKFFWKFEKQINYFQSIWHNFRFEELSTNHTSDQYHFLWIDTKCDDNMYIANRLKQNTNINVDFYETYAKGEKYILKHLDKIQSMKQFIIICRGYYAKENKNPLNLIQLLVANNLHHVYVFVFTKDKQGVKYHIEKQATSSELAECHQRLYVADDTGELIARINLRMNNFL